MEKLTHWKKFGDADTLGEYDFLENGKYVQLELTITKIDDAELFEINSKKYVTKRCAWFAETKKKAVINTTNGNFLEKLYGKYVEKWYGKKIILFYDNTVKVGKKVVGGIRVRQFVPTNKSKILCENCGAEIVANHKFDTPEKMADYTLTNYGKKLCIRCSQEMAKAKLQNETT